MGDLGCLTGDLDGLTGDLGFSFVEDLSVELAFSFSDCLTGDDGL